MPCNSCGSESLGKFTAEIAIHLPGLKNIAEPAVWVFPEIVVCLGCGTAQFDLPEAKLRELTRNDPDIPKTPLSGPP
jgi:hypothetical protein